MHPTQKAAEMPQEREIATASTEAQTDVAPFIPQKNGVGASGHAETTFIPMGNGIPMASPMGARIVTAVKIRR
jgi:hypothetical protein